MVRYVPADRHHHPRHLLALMAAKTLVVGGALAVDGLAESIKGLRRTRKDLPRVVAKVSRELAKDPVAKVARRRWAGQDIKPTMANKAIKWSGTTKGGGITLKYATVPYAAGVEFGSHDYKQFRAWRGNKFTVKPGSSTGYVVQDAIRDTLPVVERRWMNDVVEAIDKAVENG